MNRSLEAMQETHITCKHLGRKRGGMYAGCRNYLMDKAKRSKLKKAGKLILQILKYFYPVQSNYTTCYVVLHFCVHVYLCICVQVFVYLRRGNSSVRVAYVHNIPMISHCGSQLAPWLLFNGACLYMKSRQCQSNETYQMFFHFPRLFFFSILKSSRKVQTLQWCKKNCDTIVCAIAQGGVVSTFTMFSLLPC